MCYSKPGPRCSNHTLARVKKLKAKIAKYEAAGDSRAEKWKPHLAEAEDDYLTTKGGIKSLRMLGNDAEADKRQAEYDGMLAAFKEQNGGSTLQRKNFVSGEDGKVASKNKLALPDKEVLLKEIDDLKAEAATLLPKENHALAISTQYGGHLTADQIRYNEIVQKVGENIHMLAQHNGFVDEDEFNETYEQAKAELEPIRQNKTERLIDLKVEMDQHKKNAAATKDIMEKMGHIGSFNDAVDRYNKVVMEQIPTTTASLDAVNKRNAEAYKKALADTGVSFIRENEVSTFIVPENKGPKTKKVLDSAREEALNFPKSFIEGIRENGMPIIVKQYSNSKSSQLASVRRFSDNQGNLTKNVLQANSGDNSSILHEVSHYMAYNNPRIGYAESIFLMSESARDDTEPSWSGNKTFSLTNSLNRSYAGILNKTKIPLKFPASGNRLGNSHEAFTTGMEDIFYGTYGSFTGKHLGNPSRSDFNSSPSDRHRNFTLGVLGLG